ncbi:inner centromere protein A isoform X2 [Thalassophryne amazonica]|uniref:inner centromere protein A isoform X2 n=1 Tax=Thalassophryne amazonica TaxID=390379 RepID=UPI001470B9E2|nr:inner centromere protein A isoform X2 [Thalassophryne amazonica]
MDSVFSSVRSLILLFDGKVQEFISDVDNVHMVWLEEIQQEANRMFSRDFSAEPELMPKTPSQKKNSRRKRVSVGRQEESQARRRFSKGKRSNLRRPSVKALNFIAEEAVAEVSTSVSSATKPKGTNYENAQVEPEGTEVLNQPPHGSCTNEDGWNKLESLEGGKSSQINAEDMKHPSQPHGAAPSPPEIPSPEVVVSISAADRLSAESVQKLASPGRTASKIAIADTSRTSRRTSTQCTLKLRHSMAGLRHRMTQESVRRASRRSMLKKKAARMSNSACSSSGHGSGREENAELEVPTVHAESDVGAGSEESKEKMEIQNDQSLQQFTGCITRSVAANSPKLARSAADHTTATTLNNRTAVTEKQQTSRSSKRLRQSIKRKAPDTVEDSPSKRFSPPKKSNTAVRPNMRAFIHTVQKNQILMMTPSSLGRATVVKSFIKHTTPLKVDPKLSVGIVTKERVKLEALKKKQEQEEERLKKMEEEKKKKQEELKRKRDERLRRVFEAKVKEEQKEEEKKKKIEQKMAQIIDKHQAEEKAKKKVAMKRQEELEQKRNLEEEARQRKIKQAEEFLAKQKAEEDERARKLAEAQRALELKREQERERERQAAAERERIEKEKVLALQKEVEKAAREKERRELEEKRKELEEKRKLEEQQRVAAEEKAAKEREAAAIQKSADIKTHGGNGAALNVTVDIESSTMCTPKAKGGGLNVTVDIDQSPQSYKITPKGGDKPAALKNPENYGMDQNSDDSTDDESSPRKPIPAWAEGHNLQHSIMKQYFNPPDLDALFGTIELPKLENIFYKSKPRYFKRTSSAVWQSPPRNGSRF